MSREGDANKIRRNHCKIDEKIKTASTGLRATFIGIASRICRLDAEAEWPCASEVLVSAVLAAIVTAVELRLSPKVGLLSFPPMYDGVAYVVDAKSAFYRLLSSPRAALEIPYGEGTVYLTPLWDLLIFLSFTVLGEGEWQATATRFWPVFLLLLLVLWVSRRHGSYKTAVVPLLLTALLPTISASLRTGVSEYFAPTILMFAPTTTQAYIADLRPDLLSSVLMLWAVVPLFEHLENPDKRTWLVSSTAAGLCVLAKSSTLLLGLCAWGIAIAHAFISNRSQFLATFRSAVWGLIPFSLLVGPWVILGGANVALAYFLSNVFSPLWWTNSHPTFVSEATYYWQLFPLHFGYFESWILVALGLAATLASLVRFGILRCREMLGYLIIAIALYGLVSASLDKNYFLGLPFMLILWILTWRSLCPYLKEWFAHRKKFIVALLFLSIYVTVNVFAGFSGAYGLPAYEQRYMAENRNTVRNIAADMRLFLNNSDCFMYAPAYGFPATLQYYMMDKDGGYPRLLFIYISVTPEEFIQQYVSKCKVVLVFQQDIQEVIKYFPVQHISGYFILQPYWSVISQ